MSEYFDRTGSPITKETWQLYQVNEDYCNIKTSNFLNREGYTKIKTYWHGTDIYFSPDGYQIFSTKVYEGNSTETYRYASEEHALRHHEQLVDTFTDDHEVISRFAQVADEL